MSELRTALRDTYEIHYLRRNEPTDQEGMAQTFADLDAIYGSLLEPLPQGSEILDLGCGGGHLLRWLSTHSNVVPIGVDSSPGQVELSRSAAKGGQVCLADGLDFLTQNPGRFAGIFCFDVLEHIPDEDLLLQWAVKAKAALKPGGFFVCKVPNAANVLGSYSRYLDLTHVRLFTVSSLLQLLNDAARFDDCRVVPVLSTSWKGRLRLAGERQFHKTIYRITGRHVRNEVYTMNVIMVGLNR
jgi:2-polyprenyl-3-methyl-5-hydroxy-6-metoxy-1,4-benzoquinol methylase